MSCLLEEPEARTEQTEGFVPPEPASLSAAGLTESIVEEIALKFLLARGDATGRQVADQLKLPFLIVDTLLRSMKNDQLITHRGAAAMNDFQYRLTDFGRERARRYWDQCTYFGAAPVALGDYLASVAAQSLTTHQPSAERLQQAFSDLVLNKRMLDRLGPAVNSNRGLFLYGAPGNGKTSIAERVTRAFGQEVWIPRAIGIDGVIMRLFDPAVHEEMPLESCGGMLDPRRIDRRWARIRRPTLVVGGELTFSALDVVVSPTTAICEAPLQMKSNCGTLVIDDFGRQRISTRDLLNRWILPLEKRYDFLNLPNGKKIQVPFDQLIIFATNLEPSALVDEAFLRRIPYKIEVIDPTEDEFRELFRLAARTLGFEFRQGPIEDLIVRHYRQSQRPFRSCHPRDLLLQVRNFCAYKGLPLEITSEYLDMAIENYFSAT
jgi:predicted ATPase with chaperone activity